MDLLLTFYIFLENTIPPFCATFIYFVLFDCFLLLKYLNISFCMFVFAAFRIEDDERR